MIHGTFLPTVATGGYVGAFDRKCDKNGTCLLPPVTPIGLYFSTVDSVELLRGRWIYVGGACGVFRQSLDSSTGDIACYRVVSSGHPKGFGLVAQIGGWDALWGDGSGAVRLRTVC